MKNAKFSAAFKRVGALLAYAAMVLIFFLMKNQYLTASNFRSILIQASMLGIIASGMTLVMMTGGADLSVGAVAGVALFRERLGRINAAGLLLALAAIALLALG